MAKTITPEEAARLLRGDAAILVDVREPDEYAREHIEGARNLPLSRLQEAALAIPLGKSVVFHCRSGARTGSNAARLAAKTAPADALIVAGGLDAWKQAGLPVTQDRRQPLELMRQVQITTGSLVLIGVVLGTLVSPWLYGLSAFVGAGLMVAGITGTCGLASLLRLMPWNHGPAAAQAT